MPLKPLKTWGPAPGKTNRQDATRQNNNDKDASGNFVSDPYGQGDPNAMGPTMRQVYDATAGTFGGADMHNDYYPQSPPLPDPSAAGVGVEATEERTVGVTGKWPKGRYF